VGERPSTVPQSNYHVHEESLTEVATVANDQQVKQGTLQGYQHSSSILSNFLYWREHIAVATLLFDQPATWLRTFNLNLDTQFRFF
jgi:hypothetical protein